MGFPSSKFSIAIQLVMISRIPGSFLGAPHYLGCMSGRPPFLKTHPHHRDAYLEDRPQPLGVIVQGFGIKARVSEIRVQGLGFGVQSAFGPITT